MENMLISNDIKPLIIHRIPKGFGQIYTYVLQVTMLVQYCEDTNTKISGKASMSPQTPSCTFGMGLIIWSQ